MEQRWGDDVAGAVVGSSLCVVAEGLLSDTSTYCMEASGCKRGNFLSDLSKNRVKKLYQTGTKDKQSAAGL